MKPIEISHRICRWTNKTKVMSLLVNLLSLGSYRHYSWYLCCREDTYQLIVVFSTLPPLFFLFVTLLYLEPQGCVPSLLTQCPQVFRVRGEGDEYPYSSTLNFCKSLSGVFLPLIWHFPQRKGVGILVLFTS